MDRRNVFAAVELRQLLKPATATGNCTDQEHVSFVLQPIRLGRSFVTGTGLGRLEG